MKIFFVVGLMSLGLAFNSISPAPARADDGRDTLLRGYAAVLGRAGVCGVNIEPQFMRVMMWVETWYRASSQNAMEQIFFPELEGNATIQKSGKAKEDCPTVQVIFEQTQWP